MGFFDWKQGVNLSEFCENFYDKYIYYPSIGEIDPQNLYCDKVLRELTKADIQFKKVILDKFEDEFVILRFEIFSIAWLHRFGDKLSVAQNEFTKKYLIQKERQDIWDNMELYNRASPKSIVVGRKRENAKDRAYIDQINTKKVELFDSYFDKGHDGECIARAINRMYTESAFSKGITSSLLMLVLCDRLGFDGEFTPNEEAQFVFVAICKGLYNGAFETIENVKIKSY